MNPSIVISVDLNNKAANALSGMVTVGAKVDVKVTGITAADVPAWASTDDFTGKSLRFRVVDAIGRDLVRFPLVKKTADSNGDAWTVSGNEFTATGVEFDTAQLRDAMQGMPYDAKMEFGVILDSIVDDAQYAVGKLKVKQWAACPTDDPTVLPDWRETLVRLDADLVAVEAKKMEAETAANTATEKAAAAGNSATAASVSAGAAATSAAKANEYANGKTVNGVVTKGAKQYAADAAASATNLAQAVTDAQTAQTAAETAQGKAEDAQEAAETAAGNAETVLASAVKTTEQTLSDGEKTQARTNIGAQETLPLMDDGQTYGINVRGANEALTSSKAMIALKDEDGHFIKTTYANKSNLTSHTGNGGIHVTAEQKAAWSAKQDALAAFLKDAVVNGGVLTITKKDGTTVTFKGGSSAWADITGKPQSFTPEEHTHDYVPLVADVEGNKAAVTVGTRGDATVGSSSVVNGNYCFAVGNYSHAEGNGTTAGGEYSHAEGSLTTAGGDCSHAEGEMTNASGDHSHAEGEGTTASGDYSHAEGAFSTAKDQVSYTFSGDDSRENNPYESHGNGTFNINPLPQGEGETDPASGFFVGETSLKEMIGAKANTDQLPYSSTSTPADRTCATVTVASTGASVTIPKPSTANKVTAFCVYLDMTALEGTAPSIGFKYPLGEGETEAQDADILTRGGDGLSYETGAVNAVFFIQCGTKYIASAQVYK